MAAANIYTPQGSWAGPSSQTTIRPAVASTMNTYTPQAGIAKNNYRYDAAAVANQFAPSTTFGTMRTAGQAIVAPPAPASQVVSLTPPLAAANNFTTPPGLFADWDPGMGTEHLHGKVGHPLGGIPTARDFLPSLIFILLYTLLLAPVIMRVRTGMLTFGQLWRPLLAILLNIATFGIRVKLAEGHTWNKDTFIAEIVLMRLTPVLLTSALVALFRHAVQPYLPPRDSPKPILTILLRHFVAMLQLATYFCLGLTLAIAFDVKQAINGSPEAHTKLHKSKEICIYLLLVINICIWLLSAIPLSLLKLGQYTQELVVTRTRETAKFMAIVAVCTFLMVVASFKVAQLASAGRGNRTELITNEKSAFYSVCVTAEFIACALLVCLSWARLVPPRELLEMHCRLRKQAMQDRDLHGHPSIGWPTPPGQMPNADVAERDMGPMSFAASQAAPMNASIFDSSCQDRLRASSLHRDDKAIAADQGSQANISKNTQNFSNDPFQQDVEQEGNTTLANVRRDSAATLSTISEVRETPPQPKLLQWARTLTSSPRKTLRAVVHTRQKSQSDSPTRCNEGTRQRVASDESMPGLELPPSDSPQAPAPFKDDHINPAWKPSGSLPRTEPSEGVHVLQPIDFRRTSDGFLHAGTGMLSGRSGQPETVPLRSAAQLPVMIAPLERQPSSACSIRSHWSDDSEEDKERSRGSLSFSRRKVKD